MRVSGDAAVPRGGREPAAQPRTDREQQLVVVAAGDAPRATAIARRAPRTSSRAAGSIGSAPASMVTPTPLASAIWCDAVGQAVAQIHARRRRTVARRAARPSRTRGSGQR